MSLEGPLPINVAMPVVPLPHTKEEVIKWMPMLRKLLWQRGATAFHTNSGLQIQAPRACSGSSRDLEKNQKDSNGIEKWLMASS